jgi:predicted HAD superfamily Cof-like phosphohydrolase
MSEREIIKSKYPETPSTNIEVSPKYWNVPFVDEVEEFNSTFGKPNNYEPTIPEKKEFNSTFGKPNNYEPTIPEKKEWMFVYDFIQEELAEYKEACEKGDIVEILDALCDIAYVSLGNGTMLHGLKGKIWKAYQEVQASNMSKSCEDVSVAEDTIKIRSEQQGEPCHMEKVGDRYVVYRTRDRKVMKSVNYFRPNLKQFFTNEELRQTSRS